MHCFPCISCHPLLPSSYSLLFDLAFFFFSILRHNKIQHELEIEKRLFDESKKQYELSKENIDSLNIKFHDLKYRVQMLSQNQKIEESDLKDIYQVLSTLVRIGPKQTVFNPFPRWHLEPSLSECGP